MLRSGLWTGRLLKERKVLLAPYNPQPLPNENSGRFSSDMKWTDFQFKCYGIKVFKIYTMTSFYYFGIQNKPSLHKWNVSQKYTRYFVYSMGGGYARPLDINKFKPLLGSHIVKTTMSIKYTFITHNIRQTRLSQWILRRSQTNIKIKIQILLFHLGSSYTTRVICSSVSLMTKTQRSLW